MRLYFDENFSPCLIRGMREFQNGRLREGFDVLSVREEFGKGAKDEEWIPKVAQAHGIAITQDVNIYRIQAQKDLWSYHKLGLIIFRPSKKNPWNYWKVIQLTVKHWEELKEFCRRGERPFGYVLEYPGPKFRELVL